jgi:hypothetical protein
MAFVIPRASAKCGRTEDDREQKQFSFHNLFLPNLLLTMAAWQ